MERGDSNSYSGQTEVLSCLDLGQRRPAGAWDRCRRARGNQAMGALDEAPEILGHLIGAALVGTFAGIFMSYALVQANRSQDQIDPRAELPSLYHCKADTIGLHEWRDASDSSRAWPENHLVA